MRLRRRVVVGRNSDNFDSNGHDNARIYAVKIKGWPRWRGAGPARPAYYLGGEVYALRELCLRTGVGSAPERQCIVVRRDWKCTATGRKVNLVILQNPFSTARRP